MRIHAVGQAFLSSQVIYIALLFEIASETQYQSHSLDGRFLTSFVHSNLKLQGCQLSVMPPVINSAAIVLFDKYMTYAF